MATISASTPTSSITRAALAHRSSPKVASPIAIGKFLYDCLCFFGFFFDRSEGGGNGDGETAGLGWERDENGGGDGHKGLLVSFLTF